MQNNDRKGEKVRLILASNGELWWDGLMLLMKQSSDFEVLAMCHNAIETIERINQYRPDLLLLDEEIKGSECGEVAERISKLHPDVKIIIVIKPYKDISISTSFKARAKGYIDKDITYAELENCIRQVAKGGVVIISRLVAQKLLGQVANYEDTMHARIDYDISLSKREKEVLTLLTRTGITNKEIARSLHITEHTVKAHLSSILEKMKVRNRQQAAILARESGIIRDTIKLS